MPKILLVIFIALSPAFLSLMARGDDVVHQCAQPAIDPQLGQWFQNNNDTVVAPYFRGYPDPDSTKGNTIGGGGRVCDNPDERAYVCDWEATVYCVPSSLNLPDTVDHWTKSVAGKGDYVDKGRDDRKDVLRACKFAGGSYFHHIPLKNEVATDGEPSTCGFAAGAFRLPCQFIAAYHVKSKSDVERLQKKTIERELKHDFKNACRDDKNHDPFLKDDSERKMRGSESVHSIIDDYQNEGEYWLDKNHWPKVYGAPLPLPPAPVVYQPPPPAPAPAPAPVGPCDDITAQSPCSRWRDCKDQEPVPHMQLCTKCSLDQCMKVLDYVGNKFAHFNSDFSSASWIANNQIETRAKTAVAAIEKFREDMKSQNLAGSYYANDIDHCLFERFDALGDNRNSKKQCSVTSTSPARSDAPSLATLEKDLVKFSNHQAIIGLDLNSMKDDAALVHDLDTFAPNFDTRVANVTTAGVLGNLYTSDQSPLYVDTQKMLRSLYDLSIHDGAVRFSDIVNVPSNYKYFLNRTDQDQGEPDGLKVRDAVKSFYAGVNRADQCIQEPYSTDSKSLSNFYNAFTNDLSWAQTYAKLQYCCSGDGNKIPVASSSKLPITPGVQPRCDQSAPHQQYQPAPKYNQNPPAQPAPPPPQGQPNGVRLE